MIRTGRCSVVRLVALMAVFTMSQASFAQARAPVRDHYGDRLDVREFVTEMVHKHGFEESVLKATFRRAIRQPQILKAIRPSTTPQARSWQNYRGLFVNERHIAEGLRFIAMHTAVLERAEREYGIPREIIVAIIGIETFYGKNMGKWRVVDALSTLAFDYPPRADFFRSQLEAYLLFTREADLNILDVRGSYAGAIGIPQFMPGSYRRWAVDYDGDGVARLRSSPADAIGSVANYLRDHGWSTGQPITFPADPGTADTAALLAAGIKPLMSLAQFAAAGVAVHANPDTDPAMAAALIELQTPDQPSEYRAGLGNFYVITRYNRSSFYACAVIDLAQALRGAQNKAARPD